jgi:EmrB/QacA subfamily drug resistance transporter
MARQVAEPIETIPGESGEAPDPRRWWVLAAMVFGLLMPVLDNLVVNVALPTIQRELGAGVSGLAWIVDAYTLTFASFMLTGGALGDLYGRKRFFLAGLVVFTAGSLACGLSGSTGQLVAFRALQGLGAAMLLPGSLSIITATFSGKERGAAIGIWAAISGLAIAVGPVVGGYLVEHVSWESIFFINIPIGILGIAMTWFIVGESRDTTRSRRVDPPGLATGTAGIFFLVYALIEGNGKGWTDGVILGSLVLAAVLLLAFFRIEARRDSPMLPLSFFRIPTFSASNVVAASVFFALFGVTFFLTLYLQNVEGYSPVAAGLRLFPFTLMILLIAPLSGRLSDRYGSRWFMTTGTAVAAVGMALLLRTAVGSSYTTVILPAFLVLGAGLATTMAPMTSAVMGSVETRHAGVASAATNTSRELGGVFGIALLGAIVTSAFHRGLIARLAATGMPRSQAAAVAARSAGSSASGAVSGGGGGGALAPAVHGAFVHAIHVAMLVGVGFLILAAVVSAAFVRSHVTSTQGESPEAAVGH